jgi:hypothetical protein
MNAAESSAKHKPIRESRVGKGISAQVSHRTVREPLDSYGSCRPIMLLRLIASDKTFRDSLSVSLDTFYTTFPWLVFYMCSLSIFG